MEPDLYEYMTEYDGSFSDSDGGLVADDGPTAIDEEEQVKPPASAIQALVDMSAFSEQGERGAGKDAAAESESGGGQAAGEEEDQEEDRSAGDGKEEEEAEAEKEKEKKHKDTADASPAKATRSRTAQGAGGAKKVPSGKQGKAEKPAERQPTAEEQEADPEQRIVVKKMAQPKKS